MEVEENNLVSIPSGMTALTNLKRLWLSENPKLPSHITVNTEYYADTQQLLRNIQGPHNCKASAVLLFVSLRAFVGKDVARIIAVMVLKTQWDKCWIKKNAT